jgi:hypothetical protein
VPVTWLESAVLAESPCGEWKHLLESAVVILGAELSDERRWLKRSLSLPLLQVEAMCPTGIFNPLSNY